MKRRGGFGWFEQVQVLVCFGQGKLERWQQEHQGLGV